MVDNFAAKYAALDIAYPSDQVGFPFLSLSLNSQINFSYQGALAAIDAQAVEQKAAVAEFTAASNARIEGIKVVFFSVFEVKIPDIVFSQNCTLVASLQTFAQAELAKWEAMKPVEEMNKEEALDAG